MSHSRLGPKPRSQSEIPTSIFARRTPEGQPGRRDRVLTQWAFLAHFRWLLHWFGGLARALRCVYRRPLLCEADDRDMEMRVTQCHGQLETRTAWHMTRVPDRLPGRKRQLAEISSPCRTAIRRSLTQKSGDPQEERPTWRGS